MSEITNVSLEDVETIVSWQFEDVRKMTGEVSYIEISKLCKLMVTQPKLKRMIAIYEAKVPKIQSILDNPESTLQQKRKAELDLKLFTNNLAYMKTKKRESLPLTKHREMNKKRKALKLQQQNQHSELNQIEEEENAF